MFASNTVRFLQVWGAEIPRMAFWPITLGMGGAFMIQHALTDNFQKEMGMLPSTENMTQEEKNQYIAKHTTFNNRTLG